MFGHVILRVFQRMKKVVYTGFKRLIKIKIFVNTGQMYLSYHSAMNCNYDQIKQVKIQHVPKINKHKY